MRRYSRVRVVVCELRSGLGVLQPPSTWHVLLGSMLGGFWCVGFCVRRLRVFFSHFRRMHMHAVEYNNSHKYCPALLTMGEESERWGWHAHAHIHTHRVRSSLSSRVCRVACSASFKTTCAARSASDRAHCTALISRSVSMSLTALLNSRWIFA
jgi:hypothetical protein